MTQHTNVYKKFIEQYYHDPAAFAANVVKKPLDPWQAQVANDVAARERYIAIRSGHGTGKSFSLALVVAWFATTRFPFKVVMTAPTAPQLWDALWAETCAMFQNLPGGIRELFEVKSDRIELVAAPKEGFISARTSTKEKPEAMAGVHSENVLLIGDEASAIPDEVFISGSGSMSGENASTILTGNPTRLSGFFYDAFHVEADQWKTYVINGEKSPRVSKKFVESVARKYGRESNIYRVRVLGEFPESEDDVLISRTDVEDAMAREIALPEPGTVPETWGVDPARFGSDSTVLSRRRGSSIHKIEGKRNLRTTAVAGWIISEYNKLSTEERPEAILVDVIGIGAGVVDILEEKGLPVIGVNVSESADMFSDGYKLRDQLWLELRKWLEAKTGSLPNDPQLLSDIIKPQYTFMSNGKLKVESKQEMRKRGAGSPDYADSVCLTFAYDSATMFSGRRVGHRKPLRRGVRGYG